MTMLASIICSDGIVMAADKRMLIKHNMIGSPVQKLFVLPICDLKIGVSFSSNPGPTGSNLKMLIDKFVNALSQGKYSSTKAKCTVNCSNTSEIFHEFEDYCRNITYQIAKDSGEIEIVNLWCQSEIHFCCCEYGIPYIFTRSNNPNLCITDGKLKTGLSDTDIKHRDSLYSIELISRKELGKPAVVYGMEPGGNRNPLENCIMVNYIDNGKNTEKAKSIWNCDYSKMTTEDAIKLIKFYIKYAIYYWDYNSDEGCKCCRGSCGDGVDVLVLNNDGSIFEERMPCICDNIELSQEYKQAYENCKVLISQ
jgi:hypothetical protein